MEKDNIEEILNSEDENVAFFIASPEGEIGEEVTKEEFKKWLYNDKKEDK